MYQRNNTEQYKSYAINEVIRHYTSARIRERVGEEIELEVPLKIRKSKGALWILVILPGGYPSVRPIIQVINAKVTHKYIDDNFWVTHPVLKDWSRESGLLKAITTIHEEFDDQPPQLKKGVTPEMPGQKSSAKSMQLKKPDLKDLDDRIKNMSGEEIQTLIDDDEFLQDFFLQLDGVTEFCDQFAHIMKSYSQKAEENIKYKNELESHIKKHKDIFADYQDKRTAYENLKFQEQEIMEKFGPDKVEEALDNKISELEREAKQIKKEDMETDDFIEEYRLAKKKAIRYQLMKQKIFPDK